MVIAEISVTPMGTKTPSASEYVARAVRAIAGQKNIKYQLMAMGTIVEGNLADVLEAARRMHEGVFGNDVQRVVTSITIDDRRDKQLSMEYKVESVKKKLGQTS